MRKKDNAKWKIAILTCMLVIPLQVYAEDSKEISAVKPLEASLDLDWLKEADLASFAAGFSVSDFFTDEDGSSVLRIDVPYTVRISRNDIFIFNGPGYDYCYIARIPSPGTFTIVQEQQDFEGNLWGELKSGVGWIDLNEAAAADTGQQPVTAVFLDEEITEGREYVEYLSDDSETALAFVANEVLKDVKFSLLEYGEDGSWEIAEELYTISGLTNEQVFVAGISFYSDMTAYGISFKDEEGTERHFAVHISGRNGSLVLDEYI